MFSSVGLERMASEIPKWFSSLLDRNFGVYDGTRRKEEKVNKQECQ